MKTEEQYPSGKETPSNGKAAKETNNLEKVDQFPDCDCKTHLLLNFKQFVSQNFAKHGNTKMKGNNTTLPDNLNI